MSAQEELDAFWHFATTLYGHPDIEHHCLLLQDNAKANVICLLYLLWLAKTHGALPTTIITRLAEVADDWSQHMVLPLRALRRWLKVRKDQVSGTDLAPFYSDIKALELRAEQQVAQRLIDLWQQITAPADPQHPPGAAAMAHNLSLYLQAQNGDDYFVAHHLKALITAAS